MTRRRLVLPGGSGHLGSILARHFVSKGWEVTVLSRRSVKAPWHVVLWDGASVGDWMRLLDGADVVINLAGRSVNCRYNQKNRAEIMQSRIQSTRVLGEAMAQLAHPPRLWMNSSTATIYRHSIDEPMDETTGEVGGNEPGVPDTWRFSIDVATSWEKTFFSAPTPLTRRIALRSAMVMSTERGGVFEYLLNLVHLGLGGSAGSGDQFVSWIHETDFIQAVEFLINHDEFEGPVNVSSPNPIPNREFMRDLRSATHASVAISSSPILLELGALLLRTETELILKSRRVVPGRLTNAGLHFKFPDWPNAARDLLQRWNFSKNHMIPSLDESAPNMKAS